MNSLKYRTKIQLSIAASLLMGVTSHAAGLEYTKQSILPFFEPGNYAELSYAYVDPKIEGTDVAGGVENPAANQKIDDMMDDFEIWGGAVKIAPTENTALALIYDEPFGVDTVYSKGSEFNNSMGTTEARVDTRSLTVLGGGKVNNNFWVYGGMEYQEADGSVELAQNFEGDPIFYDLTIKDKSHALIPVLGVAYEKPEIMLRAALTWRAEGTHNLKAHESLLVNNGLLNTVLDTTGPTNYNAIPDEIKDFQGLPKVTFGDTQLSFKTPQSVNFDFQTGLSEKYQLLGMINARWVEWTKFNISPEGITNVVGEPLAEYKEDAYSVEVALGKQFTPKFAGEIRAGYDSGTAEPLSLLGPYDSIKTLALGGSYDVTKQLKLSAGAQYMWFEGGTAYSKLPIEKTLSERTLAKFDDGTGYALGVKLGYHF
ncbi:outer membrane protein transport protein [Psychrobacter sp. UBA3962]|uniref:outer membrane protein transport protein n=1 Tax=Psychrobacter sp. UBA3962 TaxID=1947352 RepID=UPI0025DE850D|nr:outer membrane protein transport protein [Psychrobacter sp. UBA3962]